MLHWPLNAPHRVENLDTVNISMTISYTDEAIRRLQMVNFTNGLIRHQFGYRAKSRAIAGPSFLAKADPSEAAPQQRLDQARAQGAAVGGFQARRSQTGRHRRPAAGSLSMTALAVEGSIPQVRAGGPDFRVELIHDWDEAAAKLEGAMAQGRATPFQNRHWLGAWYRCFASNEAARPLIVVVSDVRSRDVVAILPLCVRMQRGLRIAEFAGSADYNAPILGPCCDREPD